MSQSLTIQRANKALPDLKPGRHRITVSQTVQLQGDEDVSQSINGQEIVIDVRMERFQPPEVVFRHPQPAGQPKLGAILPHIVLANASLPWERTAARNPNAGLPTEGSSEPDPRPPWLALIAFAVGKIKTESGTVADLDTEKLAATDIWRPALEIERWEKNRACRYIDVPIEEFKAVVPLLSELEKLAHVQLPPDPKSSAATSVLMSKRSLETITANAPADVTVEIEMHLVSLEGFEPLLTQIASQKEDIEDANLIKKGTVRLHTLDSWSFSHTKGAQDAANEDGFLKACRGLTATSLAAKGDMFSRQGFVEFPGGSSSLYYRGPLLPGPVEEENASLSPEFARAWEEPEHCLFQVKAGKDGGGTGIDVSFAAAWQMGRLMAMGDPAFGELFARVRAGWQYLSAVRQRDIDNGWSSQSEDDARELEKLLKMGQEDHDAGLLLARLWLLEKVPLHYLIPDPPRLPAESLCPVFLDRMWADAWCWGAFSAGSHSPADFNLGYSDGMKLLFSEKMLSRRKHGVSGLLLRSRLVTDWPAMEIEFSLNDAPVPAERILRRDKVAPDVLLVLVEGRFTHATFKIPPTSQHFRAKEDPAGVKFAPTSVETARVHTHVDPAVKFEFQ